MKVLIEDQVKNTIPQFKLGVIHYSGIHVTESPQMLKGRLRLFQEKIFFDLENKKVADLDGIKEWREIFKAVGTDPNRYRPSNEALFRRIQKQQYLHPVHSAVDLNNFFSLQYEIPFGIYDKEKIVGNITLKIGDEKDYYAAINGRDVNMKNKLLTADDLGAFGSPYVDSKRTAVQVSTQNAIHFIYLRPSMKNSEAEKMLSSIAEMFTQIHGGEANYELIS
jgi:DNA/RNA-binding domain of Phe-tRNA-synthetase-like protein